MVARHVHRPSNDRPTTVHRPSTDRPPTVHRPSTDRPTNQPTKKFTHQPTPKHQPTTTHHPIVSARRAASPFTNQCSNRTTSSVLQTEVVSNAMCCSKFEKDPLLCHSTCQIDSRDETGRRHGFGHLSNAVVRCSITSCIFSQTS